MNTDVVTQIIHLQHDKWVSLSTFPFNPDRPIVEISATRAGHQWSYMLRRGENSTGRSALDITTGKIGTNLYPRHPKFFLEKKDCFARPIDRNVEICIDAGGAAEALFAVHYISPDHRPAEPLSFGQPLIPYAPHTCNDDDPEPCTLSWSGRPCPFPACRKHQRGQTKQQHTP